MGIRQTLDTLRKELWEEGARQSIIEIASGKAPRTTKTYLESELPESATKTWATYYTQAGGVGSKIWRQQQAEDIKWETARRLALEKQIAESTRIAKAQQEARERSIQEAQQRAETLRLQQQARTTGISIRQQAEEKAQQLEVVKQAEFMKQEGKSYTRLGYARELGRRTGLSSGEAISKLRSGTAREKKIFRVTGISLEEERRREAQPTDPVREMLKADVNSREGTNFMEAPPNFGEDIIFSFRDIQYGYPLEEGRISPQAYVEYKAGQVTRRMSDWLKGKTPQKIKDIPLTGDIRRLGISAIETIGKPFLDKEQRELFELGLKEKREAIKPTTVGEFMFEKEIPFRHTDLMKFAFFSPAMLSTQVTYEQAIRTGAVKPVVETRFRALIKEVDDISKVEVYSTTTIGGKKVVGLSKQFIKTKADDLVIGVGRGAVIEAKTGGARQITKFDIIGVNKRLGVARAIKDYSDETLNIALKKDIGVGVKSRVITQQTEEILRREGIGIFKRYKKTQLLEKPIVSDIIGVIKPSPKEGVFYYVGKTGKPVTRISKYGIHYRLTDINIAGVIKTLKTQADDVTRMISPAKIVKTKLVPPVQETISAQVSALARQSEKVILKDIMKPSVIKTISKTKVYARIRARKQRFADQTRRMFAEIDIQRFEPLGDLSRFESLEGLGRVKARVKARVKVGVRVGVKTRQETELKSLLNERALLKELTGVKTRQVYRTRQAQRMKMLLRTQLKFKPFEQKLITPPVLIPKGFISPPIIPLPIFRMPLGKRKKRERELGKFMDTLLYVPSMTAHVLGIKKVMSEKEMLRKAELGITLREVPIIR